jgi:polyhydroxyalkanoate synthesis regulator phasin
LNVTGSIVASGDVDAQNFNTTSDVRLKTNLEVITGALDKVEQLNAYTYDWIEDYNNEGVRQIGLVSQEVQKVQPELVHEKEVVVGNVTERMLLLDYSKVTTLLIGAVKELSEKVKQLENKIGE